MTPVPLLLLNSTTCVDILLEPTLPISTCESAMRGDGMQFSGGIMTLLLRFAGKWVRWYRVLRYAKAFSLFGSVRYGLWLARG